MYRIAVVCPLCFNGDHRLAVERLIAAAAWACLRASLARA